MNEWKGEILERNILNFEGEREKQVGIEIDNLCRCVRFDRKSIIIHYQFISPPSTSYTQYYIVKQQ